MIAVLTAALAAGAPLEAAAKLANRAAGLVVAQFGTNSVNICELVTDLNRNPPEDR